MADNKKNNRFKNIAVPNERKQGCHVCGKHGHLMRDCPKKRNAGGPRGQVRQQLVAVDVGRDMARAAGDRDAARDMGRELEEARAELELLKPLAEIHGREEARRKEELEQKKRDDVQAVKERLMMLNVSWGPKNHIMWLGHAWIVFLSCFLISVVFTWHVWNNANALRRYEHLGLHPILVTDTVAVWLVLFLVSVLWRKEQPLHVYRFRKWLVERDGDQRADALALGEMKHRSLTAIVEHTVVVRRWWRPVVLKKTKFPVSLEMLAQISNSVNLRLSSDGMTAWNRLENSVKSLHSVNIDRYYAVEGMHPAQGAALVAFGIFMQMKNNLKHVPFPTARDLY